MYDIMELKTKGLVNVPYPEELRAGVEQAVASWKLFCSLPGETKTPFTYMNGAGFELKEEKGTRKDLKEDFHVTLPEFARLEGIARKTVDPKAHQFISAADKLITLIRPILNEFASNAEAVFSLADFAKEVREDTIRVTLRFLHYFGDRPGLEEMAAPHADKGGFTLHLYESDPGLQYLGWDRTWAEMPISEGETVIIPGMQLQLRSENTLKALCHRVMANETTARQGRWSAVCFISFKNTPAYNKSGKGRLQGFDPGFNYAMDFSEFRTLFVAQESSDAEYSMS